MMKHEYVEIMWVENVKWNLPNAISYDWRWSIVVGGVGGRYDGHAWLQWRWRDCHCIRWFWWFIDDNVDWHRCIVRAFAHRCRLPWATVVRRLEFPIQNDFVRFGRLHRLLMCHLETMRFRHAAERTCLSADIRHFHWLARQDRRRHVIETVRFDEWLSCRWTGKAVSPICSRYLCIGFGQLTHVSHHFSRRRRWQWFVLVQWGDVILLLMQRRRRWRQIGTRYSKQWILRRTFGHPIV